MSKSMSGVLIGLACLLAPATANAGTMGYGQQSFFGTLGHGYVAQPGESNHVTLTFTPDSLILVDTGVPQVNAGDQCAATADPQRVECPLSRRTGDNTLQSVFVDVHLGDGDDTARVVNDTEGMTFPAPSDLPPDVDPNNFRDATRLIGDDGDDTLTAGNGFDWVIGGGGADTVDGGPTQDFVIGGFQNVFHPPDNHQPDGNDTVRGGDGDDLVEGDGANDDVDGGPGNDAVTGGIGSDELAGGAGTDRVGFVFGMDQSAVPPPEPVVADIGGGANDGGPSDGPAGARDNIHEDVEGIMGGLGDDHLTGNEGANAIDGYLGDDVIDGGGGDDVLIGGGSPPLTWDHSVQGGDADTVRGGEGNDAIDGGVSNDDLDGGPGDDVVDGGATYAGTSDVVRGGPGDDSLFGGHAETWMMGGATPIYPDGPDQFDGGDNEDTVVTRDDVWDREACLAEGFFDADAFCNPKTPQNCQPGSPLCENPADNGTCGPADDVAYLEEGDVLTDCETVDPPGPVPTAAAGFATDADRSVGTANGTGGSSAEHAVETNVLSPVSGGVAIVQQPASASVGGGQQLVPVAITTRSPASTAARPTTVAFSVDAPLVPADLGQVAVLRDGAPVAECTGPDGQASPDPCIAKRSRVAGGDASVAVRTTMPGQWRLAVPAGTSGGGPGGGGPAGNPSGDTVRPTLRLARLRSRYALRTLIRGLRVPVTCSERCTATVELRLDRKTAKRLQLKTTAGSKRKALHNRGGVTVKLTRRSATKLRRLRRQFKLLVVAKATDGAGNKSRTVSRRIRVR